MSNARKTQRNKILDLLISARGNDVPSVDLGRVSLQYGARIKELRELGFTIVNRTVRRNGAVHGYFHLKPSAIATAGAPGQEEESRLFPSEPSQQWQDPEEGSRAR